MRKPVVALVGDSHIASAIAARVAQRDHLELVIIGGGPLGDDLRAAVELAAGGATVRRGGDFAAAAGATCVIDVDGAGADGWTQIALHCPAAVAVIAGARAVERTAEVLRAADLPRQRVLGVAGEESAARLRVLLADELGTWPAACEATVVGGPGERIVVHGTPGGERLEALVERVAAREAGGPSAPLQAEAVSQLLDALLLGGTRRPLVCAVRCEGEYGIEGVAAVPVMLGPGGVQRIVELPLAPARLAALRAAAV